MLEEYLFLANLNTGLSSQLSQEFIGDRPAWVLMPSH
jgi:hypothetical protein